MRIPFSHLCLLIIPATCLFPSWLHAQTDTIYELQPVEIISTPLEYFSAGKITDTLQTAKKTERPLSELFEEESSAYIRHYGPGSLSTPAVRGGSVYHMQVLWNDVPLNSPLNGTFDLSLANGYLADRIYHQSGGGSSLWGSGAVSSTIHLLNSPQYEKGLSVETGLTAGSNDAFTRYGSLQWSGKSFSSGMRIISHDSENDFRYDDGTGNIRRQTNANVSQLSVLSENYFRHGKNNFSLHAWLMESDRKIPPALNLPDPMARQEDEALRFNASWKRKGKFPFRMRSALFLESLVFNDQNFYQLYPDRSRQSVNGFDITPVSAKGHTINVGIQHTYTYVRSASYANAKELNLASAMLSYRFMPANEKLVLTASLRQEFSVLSDEPLAYSASAQYIIRKAITLRSSVNRVYRLPTFNDLFWNPGGNPALEPEKGYSFEAGTGIEPLKLFRKTPKRFRLVFDLNLFSKDINNWIIWLPVTWYWGPQNLLEVRSQGAETRLHSGYTAKDFSAEINSSFSYVSSVKRKATSASDASAGKQLIYIPLYRSVSSLTMKWKSLTARWHFSYTGYRYTSSDNTSWLEPFSIQQLSLGSQFSLPVTDVEVFGRVNNLANTNYQLIQNRPMPLRTYEAGILLKFKIKKP